MPKGLVSRGKCMGGICPLGKCPGGTCPGGLFRGLLVDRTPRRVNMWDLLNIVKYKIYELS